MAVVSASGLEGLRTAVLGATSGIGRAVALRLAEAGAAVIVHGRSGARAEQVAAQCTEKGARDVAVVLAELESHPASDHLLDAAWSRWGGLDAWLHIAGADTLTGRDAALSFEQKLTKLWAVDVEPTIRLCRQVGERMRAQGSGSIVTMGWDQAETGLEGDSGELFAATKGAIMAFTRSLAVSLAPEVRVNCVAPGWIKTKWGEHASDNWQARVIRETPLKRWGSPEDVADACCFLVGPGSSFLTGQVMRVNGGVVR